LRLESPTQKNKPENSSLTFADIQSEVTAVHFGRHSYKYHSKTKPDCSHLKAFIQVRSIVKKHRNGVPMYCKVHNIKKDALIDMCLGLVATKVNPRLFDDVDTTVVSDTDKGT
jgi:hypothetical protein